MNILDQLHFEEFKRNPDYIADINPSYELQLAILNHSGEPYQSFLRDQVLLHNIRYIKNPDKEIQMISVTRWPESISDISNPDYDVQLAAINQNLHSFECISNPHPDIITLYERLNHS